MVDHRDRREGIDQLKDQLRQPIPWETIMGHIPVGVMVVDPHKGVPLWSNQAAHQLLAPPKDPKAATQQYGLESKLYIPGTNKEILHSELPVVRVMKTLQTSHGQHEIEHPTRGRVGLDVTAAPVFDKDGVLAYIVVLFQDITEKQQRYREQLRLLDQMIETQAMEISEYITPLIPISDEILVVPVVGTLSAARTQQTMEALLNGIVQRRVSFAILDVTGVKTIDTQAANSIIEIARAVRLLGAEVVLTGIHPDVAQILVSLGVDLSITTRGTLQSGIAYATKQKRLRGD